MEQQMDYFTKRMNENRNSQKRSFTPTKKGVSYWTFIIIIISILVVVFILFKKYDSIRGTFISDSWSWAIEDTQEFDFKIWDQVNLSWNLYMDEDIISSYTHKLNTFDWDIFWLKSRTLDLSDYNWEVQVEWIIEKLVGDMFVIEVNNIQWEVVVEETWLLLSSGKYLSKPGIYLDSDFFENYILQNEWEDWNLIVKNLETSQIITISYFRCNDKKQDENCKYLNDVFSKSAEKDFTTLNRVSFYKLDSIDSWFFSNENMIWYFINNVWESEVMKISDYIILPNKKYVEENLMSEINSLCKNDQWIMDKINSYDLSFQNNDILLTVKWNYSTWFVTCKLILNPWFEKKLILQTFILDEVKKIETPQWTLLKRDANVKQFPINLEKPLVFNSSTRWYKISFPSMNISFAGTNTEETFDQVWVYCFTQMDVIKYSDKDKLHDMPSIKIYECNMKNWFQETDQLVYRKVWDKNFVIEILDSSWIEFVNNIVIE